MHGAWCAFELNILLGTTIHGCIDTLIRHGMQVRVYVPKL